jgi:hypothetical protein
MKNNIVAIAIVVICFTGTGFFGGMQYQKSQRPSFGGNGTMQGGPNGASGAMGAGRQGGSQPVSGQVTSIDANSMTIKTPNGSSKILLLSSDTTIQVATTGSRTDLSVGAQVTATGSISTDGTMTVKNVSVGVTMMTPPQGDAPAATK